MPEIRNNKDEVPLSIYKSRYRGTDPYEVCARTGVPYDADRRVFTLTLMQSVYEIAHPEFAVRFLEGPVDRLSGDLTAHIIVIRYLLEGHLIPACGTFRAYRDMPWGEVYDANFQNRCIRRLARTFAGKGEAVAEKMGRLGGVPYEKGDIGWEFAFLPGLVIRFSIWNADDEFPASAQILFSDNFSYAFTAEDMAVIGDIFIAVLSRA